MFVEPLCGSHIPWGDAYLAWAWAAPGTRGVLPRLEEPAHWFCVTERRIWDSLQGDYHPTAEEAWSQGLVKAWAKVQEWYASRLVGPCYLVALPNAAALSATKGADMGAYTGLARDKPLTLTLLNSF